ncbi:MAG: hypothetical protein U0264_07855 [Candidatus Kapaibacterium sp.]
MMKNTIITMLLLGAVVLLGGCPGESVKPDPCAGVVETSADFTINELSDTYKFETDTVLPYNTVEFSAKYPADEYEWKVGFDDRTWTTKTFTLDFHGFSGSVNVRLIAKRKTINKECTPDDDGIDTVTKTLVVIVKPAIVGSFRGVNIENPLDTFTISVRSTEYRGQSWFEIINMNKGCYDTTTASTMFIAITHKAIIFGNIYTDSLRVTCWDPQGVAQLYPDRDHIQIVYNVVDQDQPMYLKDKKKRKYFTFKGVRI